jgi:hypothetical protein
MAPQPDVDTIDLHRAEVLHTLIPARRLACGAA